MRDVKLFLANLFGLDSGCQNFYNLQSTASKKFATGEVGAV